MTVQRSFLLLSLSLFVVLSGCASDKLSTDYLKARATEPLTAPKGLSLPAPSNNEVTVDNLSPQELKSIDTEALFMPPQIVDANTPDSADSKPKPSTSLGVMKTDDNGAVFLQIPLRYDEAWSRVRLGLMSSGFTITDMNRSEGKFYLRYRDPDAGKDQPDQFILHLLEVGGGSRLLVRSEDGKILANETARHILKLVNDNL